MKTNLILITLLFFFGCKKPADRTCIKSNGELSSLTIDLQEGIQKINLYDDLNLILINDSLNYINIEGPENLIGLTDFSILNTELSIANTNRCNFLRSKKNINIYYHYTNLNEICLYGYGTLSNTNAIHHPINIYTNEAFSSITLSLNNLYTSIFAGRGSTEINLKGYCSNFYCYSSGLAPINGLTLQVQKAHINSNTISTIEIHATDTLFAEIRSFGNIYYQGNPLVTGFSITGEGEVIHL